MRILIVEDEITTIEALDIFFEDFAHHVEYAQTYSRACTKIDEIEYDLYIIDIKLDEKDGYELAQRIREKKRNGAVMLMTGYPLDIAKAKFADLAIEKPLPLEEIEEFIINMEAGINMNHSAGGYGVLEGRVQKVESRQGKVEERIQEQEKSFIQCRTKEEQQMKTIDEKLAFLPGIQKDVVKNNTRLNVFATVLAIINVAIAIMVVVK